MRTLLSRIRALFLRPQVDDDPSTQMFARTWTSSTADYMRRGVTREQARLAARRAFGGVEQMKDSYRDGRTFRWVEDMWRDAPLRVPDAAARQGARRRSR